MLSRLSIFLIVLIATTAVISAQSWKKIGSKTIDLKNINDTIVIKDKVRTYSKFKLSVSGASVRVSQLVFTFRNGEQRKFNTPFTVDNGESTNAVDLGGIKSGIDRIHIRYESRSLNGKNVKVTIFAIPDK